jgi:hypothetical protein
MNETNFSHDAKFEVLMVAYIEFAIFCAIAPHSVVVGYKHFRGPGSMVFQHYTQQQHRKSSIQISYKQLN